MGHEDERAEKHRTLYVANVWTAGEVVAPL
jgi:hypothetical protein